MSASQNTSIDAGLGSVLQIERLLERLPAEQRANVAWFPTSMKVAFTTFMDGPRDEASLQALIDEVIGLMRRIQPVLATVVENHAVVRDEVDAKWRSDEEALCAYLGESAAADAAHWAIRAWVALVDYSVQRIAEASAAGGLADASPQSDGSRLLWRMQVLIMVAIEAARRQRPLAVSAELAFEAFDAAQMFFAELQTLGISLDPFNDETAAEKAVRTRRYAAHVRAAMTTDDVVELERSRMRTLR